MAARSLQSSAPRAKWRSAVKQAILFGLLYYVLLLLLSGLIFLISHIPPKAVNLDAVILALAKVESILTWPRRFLLWLCPGERTPGWLGFVTSLLNVLVWGFALMGVRRFWRHATAR